MKMYKKIFKVCSSTFLASTLVLSVGTAAFAQAKDVENHWAKNQITKWVDAGYVTGYEDGTFKPDNSITRAEFIRLVNQSFDFTEVATIAYTDVSPSQWFYSEVAKAKAAGYISGYEDGTMKPNDKISRQEAAAIIQRLLNLPGTEASSFQDGQTIASWAKGAVGSVAANKIMNGYPDGTFKPANDITRAESIVTLDKAVGDKGTDSPVTPQAPSKTYDKAGTYGAAAGKTDTIQGDVIISAADVRLQNMVIDGNLFIAESVGSGNVYLNNVTIKGATTVKGGGSNSIYAADSTLNKVVVNKNDVHLVASGTTVASSVVVQSGAKIEQGSLSSSAKGFGTVSIDTVSSGTVKLVGSFASVTVDGKASIELSNGKVESLDVNKGAEGASLTVLSDASVKNLTVNGAVKVYGSGKIENAKVNVNGVSFANRPTNLQIATGVTVSTSSSGGGGSSSGGSSTTKKSYANGEKINVNDLSGITSIEITSGMVTLDGTIPTGKTVTVKAGATLTGTGTINGDLILENTGTTLRGITVNGTTTIK
ncbi:S-layer homology domain-containing protein [Aneurinibacillus uraniidurans]|uniref:S-layer homology domain-containing protein n=1 Tax=Aneurinibacillus uraniidurans TaxID=2966586 RepID=UPI00234B5B3F|nr:S-layer homology domain-containing protein [Aneurinibacillus sp. B1]WCN38115.1 S-layer homology domain-containing protein [Aneurinibacillus sp. B1]